MCGSVVFVPADVTVCSNDHMMSNLHEPLEKILLKLLLPAIQEFVRVPTFRARQAIKTVNTLYSSNLPV